MPEIRASLIDAQKRCADADFHEFTRAKFGECSPAHGCVRFLEAVGSGVLWSLPELNDEVAFEVRQLMRAQVGIHAMRVIAGDLAGFPIDRGKARDARPGHFDSTRATPVLGNRKRKNAQRSVAVISARMRVPSAVRSETA